MVKLTLCLPLLWASQDLGDLPEDLDLLGHKVTQDPVESLESLDLWVPPEPEGFQERRVDQEKMATMVVMENQESEDSPELLVPLVVLDSQDSLEPRDTGEVLDLVEQEEKPERPETRDLTDLLDPWELLDLLVSVE